MQYIEIESNCCQESPTEKNSFFTLYNLESIPPR